MRGAFVIGGTWHFMILKKLEQHRYTYFRSLAHRVLSLDDLTQIYVNLQAVKSFATAAL
ncbi:MAG: hypothetical protein AAF639_04965 [Chloroflexota bacterium]